MKLYHQRLQQVVHFAIVYILCHLEWGWGSLDMLVLAQQWGRGGYHDEIIK